jgi:hypothetical protein
MLEYQILAQPVVNHEVQVQVSIPAGGKVTVTWLLRPKISFQGTPISLGRKIFFLERKLNSLGRNL